MSCIFPTPLRVKGGLRARNTEITNRLSRLEGLLSKLNEAEAHTAGSGDRPPTSGTTTTVASNLSNVVAEQLRISPRPVHGSPGSMAAAGAQAMQATQATQALQDAQAPILKPDGSRYLGDGMWASLSSEVGSKQRYRGVHRLTMM